MFRMVKSKCIVHNISESTDSCASVAAVSFSLVCRVHLAFDSSALLACNSADCMYSHFIRFLSTLEVPFNMWHQIGNTLMHMCAHFTADDTLYSLYSSRISVAAQRRASIIRYAHYSDTKATLLRVDIFSPYLFLLSN